MIDLSQVVASKRQTVLEFTDEVRAFFKQHGHAPTNGMLGNPIVDLLYYTDLVTWLDGAPFYIEPHATIPMTNNLRMYRKVYQPIIQKYGGQELDFLHYPIPLKEDTSWDVLMKRVSSYRPHMLGSKSQVVKWRMVFDPDEIIRINLEMAPVYYHKVLELTTDKRQIFGMFDAWWRDFIPTPDCALVIAEEGDKIIAVMQIFVEDIDNEVWIECRSLANYRTPEYKTYSLSVCCHLAVMRDLYFNNEWKPGKIRHMNYGENVAPMGNYKRVFAHLEPMYGIGPEVGLANDPIRLVR